jgi:hypothetical protein
MTLTTWGPALDAEIAYRQEQARRAWPRRRPARAPRPTRDAPTARPAGAGAPAAPPEAPAAVPLRALAGGGARQGSLRGSEAWPAA